MNSDVLLWIVVALPLAMLAISYLFEVQRRAAFTCLLGMILTTVGLAIESGYWLLHLSAHPHELQVPFLTLSIAQSTTGTLFAPSFDLELGLHASVFSVILATLVVASCTLVAWIGYRMLRGAYGVHRAYAASLLMTFGAMCACLSGGLITTYVSWMVIGFSSWYLSTFLWQQAEGRHRAKQFFLIDRTSDLLLLAGCVLVFVKFGSYISTTSISTSATSTIHQFTFVTLQQAFLAASHGHVHGAGMALLDTRLLAVCIGGAALLRIGAFPFGFALEATAESPLPLAGISYIARVVAASVILWKFMPLFMTVQHAMMAIFILGVLGAAASAVYAWASDDLAHVATLVLQGIALMGVVFFAAGGYVAGIVTEVTDVVLAAGLYTLSAHLILQFRSRFLGDIQGISGRMPMTRIVLVTCTAGVVGVLGWTLEGSATVLWNAFPHVSGHLNVVIAVLGSILAFLALILIGARMSFVTARILAGPLPDRRGFDARKVAELPRSGQWLWGIFALVLGVWEVISFPPFLADVVHGWTRSVYALLPTLSLESALVGAVVLVAGVGLAALWASNLAVPKPGIVGQLDAIRQRLGSLISGGSVPTARAWNALTEILPAAWGEFVIRSDDHVLAPLSAGHRRVFHRLEEMWHSWEQDRSEKGLSSGVVFAVFMVVGIVIAVWVAR